MREYNYFLLFKLFDKIFFLEHFVCIYYKQVNMLLDVSKDFCVRKIIMRREQRRLLIKPVDKRENIPVIKQQSHCNIIMLFWFGITSISIALCLIKCCQLPLCYPLLGLYQMIARLLWALNSAVLKSGNF